MRVCLFILSVVALVGCSEITPEAKNIDPSKIAEVGYVIEQLNNTSYGHVQFILYPDDGNVFSSDTLRTVDLLTERAWRLPHSNRVDSITNIQQISCTAEDFILSNLIPNVQDATAASLQEIKQTIIDDPSLVDRLYYPASSSTLIDVNFYIGRDNTVNKMLEISDAVVSLKNAIESFYPVTVHLTGNYVSTVPRSSKALMFDLSSVSGNNGVSDVNYLLQLANFSDWLKQQAGVLNVTSYSDLVKKISTACQENNADWNKITDRRSLGAQYLLLYEMTSPWGLGTKNVVNINKSGTRVTAIIENASTDRLSTLQMKSAEWLKLNAPNIEFDPENWIYPDNMER